MFSNMFFYITATKVSLYIQRYRRIKKLDDILHVSYKTNRPTKELYVTLHDYMLKYKKSTNVKR